MTNTVAQIIRGGGSAYLIDPRGKRLTIPYQEIRIEAGRLVAVSQTTGTNHLLDPSTGKELCSYPAITSRDGLLIGVYPTGSEVLLDRLSGQTRSGSHERIERQGAFIVGRTKPFSPTIIGKFERYENAWKKETTT